jgi:hypothetical protein
MLIANRTTSFLLTQHASLRSQQRNISLPTIDLVTTYGRKIHTRGATFMVVGRKEVDKYKGMGIDLSKAQGVHVLLSTQGQVITTYRNHDLRNIRPKKRKHAHH